MLRSKSRIIPYLTLALPLLNSREINVICPVPLYGFWVISIIPPFSLGCLSYYPVSLYNEKGYLLEIFAVKENSQNPSPLRELRRNIKDCLFSIFEKDFSLISQKVDKKLTRAWRVLYLLDKIIEKTPSAMVLFLDRLKLCLKAVIKMFIDVFINQGNQGNQRILFQSDINGLLK